MKHTHLLLCCVLALGGACAAQQSLADAARAARKDKPQSATAKVITNDNIGFGESSPDAAPAKDASAASTGAAAKDAPKTEQAAADAEADKAKAGEALKKDYADAKKELDQLKRELDVMQRENRLKAAAFYGDAGTRLRDEAKYTADQRQYETELAGKKKAVADGEAKLAQLEEEARRANIRLQ
jgi:hypothetical protein